MSVRDNVLFLRDWISAPLQVAAIAPSSLSLAHIMTSEISFCDAPILELGPGTGVFTRQLIQKGIPQENLVLVERSEGFADLLGWRFPRARIICCDASKLIVDEHIVPGTVGAVLSGLPLAIMPAQKVMTIMQVCFSKPEARLVLLPIHLRSKVPGRSGNSRPMRSELDAHRTYLLQRATRLGLSDFSQVGDLMTFGHELFTKR